MSDKKYDLHDNDLMTATEASLRWGYDSSYVRQMKKKYPNKIPEGEIRLFGKTLVITREGMEALTGRKEPIQRFFVIEEDNLSVQSQKEVGTFEDWNIRTENSGKERSIYSKKHRFWKSVK